VPLSSAQVKDHDRGTPLGVYKWCLLGSHTVSQTTAKAALERVADPSGLPSWQSYLFWFEPRRARR